MNDLDTLVERLCPNGVEFVPMGSLMTRVREKGKQDPTVSQVYVVSNTRGIVRAEDYRENTVHSKDTSNYTVIRSGMVAYNPSRLNIGSIAMLNYDEPGLVSPMYVVFKIDQTRVTTKYFEFLMKSTYVSKKIDSYKEEGARFRFDYTRWDWINVQIPPIEIQNVIVEMLESFSKLIVNLNEELRYRKMQYNHYLDLYFGKNLDDMEQIAKAENYEILPLSKVGTLQRGKRFVKADSENLSSGTPCIHYGEVYTFYGTSAKKPKSYISPEKAKKLRFATKGDVVIVGAGENNIDIGIGVAWFGNEDVVIHDACYTFHHDENPMYISYYLRSNLYHNQIKKYVSEGKICAISAEGVGKAIMPLPDRTKQDEIVKVLSVFDKLCNDQEHGLPAEINYREKQFSYYRDKLLTFEEA